MDTSIITATGLHRTYGTGSSAFEAVRGIDLHVRRGELFALLGTNGAGKTSTLEVLEGLAPATAGDVRVVGHDPYRARNVVRPRTGIMLQDAGFPPELTESKPWYAPGTTCRSQGTPADAVRALSALTVVPVDAALVGEALELLTTDQLSYWDALIVAAARRSGCTRILTEDLRTGGVVAGLRIENPFGV